MPRLEIPITIPLYGISPRGEAENLGLLIRSGREQFQYSGKGLPWPAPDPEDTQEGVWPRLLYPLHDLRPQGYLGRRYARDAHVRLGLPNDPRAWSDMEVLYALSRDGVDNPGHLLIGEVAFQQWRASLASPPALLSPDETGAGYCRMAEQSIAHGIPGSSAAGEFPKFTALRELSDMETPHVIVKFSGIVDFSPTVRRWADLLVCEHLAQGVVSESLGIPCAKTRILQHGGRVFLESERFDRHDLSGRSPVLSLDVLNAVLCGKNPNDWEGVAWQLHADALLSRNDAESVCKLRRFGEWIGNTDMHGGNLAFRPGLQLAPIYDMLPMLYAPHPGGELPNRDLNLANEAKDTDEVIGQAAAQFWQLASTDDRISPEFRDTCEQNAVMIEAWQSSSFEP